MTGSTMTNIEHWEQWLRPDVTLVKDKRGKDALRRQAVKRSIKSVGRFTTPGPGLLEDFIALAHEENPEAFLKYATRWGMVGLCRHRLPANHHLSIGHMVALPREHVDTFKTNRYEGCSPEDQESISAWRFYSQSAAMVLDAGEYLHGR